MPYQECSPGAAFELSYKNLNKHTSFSAYSLRKVQVNTNGYNFHLQHNGRHFKIFGLNDKEVYGRWQCTHYGWFKRVKGCFVFFLLQKNTTMFKEVLESGFLKQKNLKQFFRDTSTESRWDFPLKGANLILKVTGSFLHPIYIYIVLPSQDRAINTS